MLLLLNFYFSRDQMSILNQVNCKTFFTTPSLHHSVCKLGRVDCQALFKTGPDRAAQIEAKN